MTDPVTTLAHDAGAVLADLVECLAAIGRSMQDEFDPRHFLEEFSAKVERLIPHDRLVIACRDDDSTFTIFAEHVKAGPVLHARHYTTGFSPEGRYPLGDGALRAMLEGQTLSLLLTLVATPVFYSLFDDLSTRVTPRLWIARLFGRRTPAEAHPITGGGDS